jgi:hypothetical protein
MARQLVGDTPEARRLWLESLDAVGRMAAFRAVDPEQQRKWAPVPTQPATPEEIEQLRKLPPVERLAAARRMGIG